MQFIFSPDWFLGNDVLIEGFSFLVLATFFFLCWKYYKLSKNKNMLYLGTGFFLIALAQLATICTKLVLYYDTSFIQQIGQMVVTYHVVKSVDIFYQLGFFFNKFLTLIGLYMIYRLPDKKKFSKDFLLAFYFIIISAAASANINFIFHITVLVLLVMIIQNYLDVYRKNKSKNTLMLIIAFSALAFAHFIFTFSHLPLFFVAGNIIELLSFVLLLVLIIRIFRAEYKTKTIRKK